MYVYINIFSTSKEDLDLERNINDAVAVLPKLSTGSNSYSNRLGSQPGY